LRRIAAGPACLTSALARAAAVDRAGVSASRASVVARDPLFIATAKPSATTRVPAVTDSTVASAVVAVAAAPAAFAVASAVVTTAAAAANFQTALFGRFSVSAPPSGSGDPWTARKLDGAVARQREHERWWEKPLDLDAGYDDDFFAVFGDGM